MTQTLYVVMGTEGEYSDRTEWPVRAFVDPLRAADHVVKATARANEIVAQPSLYCTYTNDPAYVNEFDPTGGRPSSYEAPFFVDGDDRGGRVRYYVMDVPLDDDVRDAIAATVVIERGRRAIALGGAAMTQQQNEKE